MGKNPSRFKGNLKYPVDNISWRQVHTFIRRLNKQEGGPPYRLPTEAEWEYAARAGSTTLYSFGDDASQLDRYAWYKVNANNSIQPVGGKQPNVWGLYDMHGNVWEWVQDPWHDNYDGAPPDGSVWESSEAGAGRVVRGGSWGGSAGDCRSAYRHQDEPDSRYNYLGFRCARAHDRVSEDRSRTQPSERRAGRRGWGAPGRVAGRA